MNRREFLGHAGALGATVSASLASSRTPPALPRGLFSSRDADVGVGRFPEFGDGLFLFDYAEARISKILTIDDGFRLSPSLDGAASPDEIVEVAGSALRVGRRTLRMAPIERIPMRVTSDGVTLSAEIAWRRGAGPSTCVVMVYGSGPAPKEAFDPWAFWFLARGHAVLTWDKRGSGRSTGDFRLAGLETLAADAVRVIERARRDHPKQTRRLIGWGASQGGWILPQLGAKGAIDGAILHAGSAMKPGDQIVAAVEAELIAYEFPRDEIERALAFYRLDTDVSLGRAPWNAANEAYRAAVARGAEWLVAPLASKDAPERTMIRLMAEFDPAPFWRMNQAPTLAIFGSKDWTVPADPNRQGLEALVPLGRRLRTVTLKDANHLMFLARTGYRTEYPSLSRLHPEYFPEIDAWLTAEGVPQGERAHERNASTVG